MGTQSRRAVLGVCGLLLLAVGGVFGQTVRHEFVIMDDGAYVSENPHISRGLTASGIAWVFTHSHVGNWHPLTGLSHMLDSQIYGLWAGGHHLTNVLLHAATAIVLFLVLWQITGAAWPSAMVAALFALHPLRVESVAWVAERKDVLSGLCFVLTLGAYVWFVRGPFSWSRYLLLLVIFALGLMAKPMLVTLPAVLLLLDYWPLGRFADAPGRHAAPPGATRQRPALATTGAFRWQLLTEKIPLLLLVAVFCLATVWAQDKAAAFGNPLTIGWRIANALVSYVAYLVQAFWPVGLAAYYPHPEYHLPIWEALGALVVLAGISAAALKWRRRYPYFLVGWLWYVGMLVPVIGIVQVGSQAMADRYTYLPQIGLYLALVWGVADVCRSRPYRRWLCGVGSALVLAVLMGCAWRQTCFWCDNVTLWNHTLACTTGNSAAENNLGLTLANRGHLDEAMEHYREALRFRPDYMEAHTNLGTALAGRGRKDEALVHFQKALEIKPSSAIAHNNLASAMADLGRIDEATRHYQKAVEIEPDYVQARVSFAALLSAIGRRDEAAVQYQKVLDIEPDNAEVYTNFGNALGALGRIEEAMAQYRKALEIKPQSVEAHINFGYILTRLGRFDEAMAHYQKALKIKPDTPELQNNIALAKAGQGRFDEAIAYYRKALKLNPDYVIAHNGLAIVLVARGQLAEAIAHYREALKIKPDCIDVHVNLGNALLRLGQRDEALRHFGKVVELSPADAVPRNNLGVILATQGRFTEAAAQFQKALQIQPDYVEARKSLAWLRASCPEPSLRNGAEAIEHARRADQLCGGQRVDVLDALGAAYAEAGRFPDALTTAHKALDLATRQKARAWVDVLQTRIALYEAGKPYHQTPPLAEAPPKR
jgi:tetratricopeptide (TPR) repeat protein